MKRNLLSEYAHRMIRSAILDGEPISEVARAWGTSYGNAWLISKGRTKPFKPSGAAAGTWKDYGPMCKRGHQRPEVHDSRKRRCRPCQAMRARRYYIMKRVKKGKTYQLPRQLGHGVQAVL